MYRSGLAFALLAVMVVSVFGCGGESKLDGTVPVSGTVKQKGAPLAGAIVTFAPTTQGVRAASATTDANGQFKLTTLQAGDGAFPGEFQVTITKTETVGKTYTSEEANEYYNQHQTQPPSPEIKNLLDAKYASIETSGLKASVKAGEPNDFTFEVE